MIMKSVKLRVSFKNSPKSIILPKKNTMNMNLFNDIHYDIMVYTSYHRHRRVFDILIQEIEYEISKKKS